MKLILTGIPGNENSRHSLIAIFILTTLIIHSGEKKSGFPLGNSHDEGGITDIAKKSLFKNFTQVHEKCTNSFMDPIMDVLKKVKDGGQHPHMSLRNAMVAAGHSEKPFDLVGLVKDTVTKGWNLGQYGLTL